MSTTNRDNIKPFAIKPGRSVPYLSIVGFSGSGKTTLMERLIGELTRRGLRIGSIKHDAHGFEMDHPGKDSWRHKQAGAAVSMIASPHQIGMVREVDRDHGLEELVAILPDVDLVMAEGFKRGKHPKIEVYRPEANSQPACMGDPDLMAVVSYAAPEWGVPCFAFDDLCTLADFILNRFQLQAPGDTACAGLSF
jgi:molybdopterin-guanine dinucleotide biosynthesis protein B